MNAAPETFDALKATAADYAARRAEVLSGARRPRAAAPAASQTTPGAETSTRVDTASRATAPVPVAATAFDARTASANDYAAARAAMLSGARGRRA